MARSIDLNADMGEGFGPWAMGDDAALMDVVTSANIACGFHAGDPVIMRRTVRMARAKGVAVGAHPSFADLAGFGRRRLPIADPAELESQLIYQIAALQGICRAEGIAMTHVKPHGALANMAAEDAAVASICLSATRAVDARLPLTAMPHSALMQVAQAAGHPTVAEVYADRRYDAKGMLLPRSAAGAVIHDAAEVIAQVREMVLNNRIPVQGGAALPVQAATVCIHSDTAGAVDLARAIRAALLADGVTLAPVASRA